MIIVYNAGLPTVKKVQKEIFKNLTTENNYRLIPIQKLKEIENNNQDLINLLNSCPLTFKRKKILVDIKYKKYVEKETTCFKMDFHLDGRYETKIRDKNNDNIYHIFILGEVPTIFIKHPFSVDIKNNKTQQNVLNNINFNVMPKYILPTKVWNSYGEFHWHQGQYIKKPCERLFIKVIETNYIKETKY